MDNSLHGILCAGWDMVNGGWAMECVCGWASDVVPFMATVGEQFDDHLRIVGVLNESNKSNNC